MRAGLGGGRPRQPSAHRAPAPPAAPPRSAGSGQEFKRLRDAALDTFGVVAACVPQFLHEHLEGILDTLVKLEGLVVSGVDEEGAGRRR